MGEENDDKRPGVPLPPALFSMLDGQELASKIGQTFLISTCDDDGWPQLALLSVGEVLAVAHDQLRLATYTTSGTTRRLAATGRCLLVLILDGTVYKIRLIVEELALPRGAGVSSAAFRATVADCVEDKVGYAEVVNGIEYRLADESAVIERWERQLAWLSERPT